MDHAAITDGQLEVLLEEFTVPQVVELLTWIAFEYAGQMFGALIGDEPATAEEARRLRGRGRRPAAAAADDPSGWRTCSGGGRRPDLRRRISGAWLALSRS